MENTDLFLGSSFDPGSDDPINFLETRLTDLSPFSAHEIEIEGVVYKTAEHAYQALRVQTHARAAITAARSPMDAWREGQKCKERNELIPDHNKDELMERILRAKLLQHEDVRRVLLMTGERKLLKVFDDAYWGTGKDGGGENRMGKIWMKLRSELQV